MLRIIHILNDTTGREAIILDTEDASEETLLDDYRIHPDDQINSITKAYENAGILPTERRLEARG